MNTDVAITDAPSELPKIEAWPAERMREGLASAEPETRVHALAMTVQPEAEIDECVAEIVACVELSRTDPIACQLAAVALGNVKRDSEKLAAANCLATLTAAGNAPPVRTFAAHGLAQLGQIPPPAWPGLAQMLFLEDGNERQVALRAVAPFAVQGAGFIAQATANATPVNWTVEGLAALALSAGNSADSKLRVEQYVMRSLQGQVLLPTGIAGYAALARLNPNGVAPAALAKIASADDDKTAITAIHALAQLGEAGKSAVPGLIEALGRTDNPEREEAICRALLRLRVNANDVPLPRVLKRIESGPDRAVAAHCLLLSFHAKSFAATSRIVAGRFQISGDALRAVLDAVHHQLVGAHLATPQDRATTPQTPNQER